MMQLYTSIAYQARGLDPDFDKYQSCEYCEHRYYNHLEHPNERCPKQRREIPIACDIDHIDGRGGGESRNYENRMYDAENLIMLCRRCHELKRGSEMRKLFKKIVLSKISKNDNHTT